MKKTQFFMAAAFALAVSTAFVTKGSTLKQDDEILYKRINPQDCQEYTCGSTGMFLCTDLYQTCNDSNTYSGGLRRSIV